jgi:hypothetical protein
MPRNRLHAQLDEELVQARASLVFWQAETILLASTPFLTFAERQVVLREIEIKQLLEAREALDGVPDV